MAWQPSGYDARMTQIWALYRQSGPDRLEKQPTDLRQNTSYFGDGQNGAKLRVLGTIKYPERAGEFNLGR